MTRPALLTLLFATNFALIGAVGAVGGEAEQTTSEPALVATQLLTASRHEVELSQRVGALLAGNQQTLAFENTGPPGDAHSRRRACDARGAGGSAR